MNGPSELCCNDIVFGLVEAGHGNINCMTALTVCHSINNVTHIHKVI